MMALSSSLFRLYNNAQQLPRLSPQARHPSNFRAPIRPRSLLNAQVSVTNALTVSSRTRPPPPTNAPHAPSKPRNMHFGSFQCDVSSIARDRKQRLAVRATSHCDDISRLAVAN